MATTSPTFDTLVTRTSWRERIKITRMTIFSLLFVLMGVIQLTAAIYQAQILRLSAR